MNLNLARFDLVSIRLAVVCAELGSLSAAARHVHCSLATASIRVRALEDALGVPLFSRDHRGLHTTAAGEVFVLHAAAILEHLASIQRDIGAPARPRGLQIFRSPE